MFGTSPKTLVTPLGLGGVWMSIEEDGRYVTREIKIRAIQVSLLCQTNQLTPTIPGVRVCATLLEAPETSSTGRGEGKGVRNQVQEKVIEEVKL